VTKPSVDQTVSSCSRSAPASPKSDGGAPSIPHSFSSDQHISTVEESSPRSCPYWAV
jgi:hypothetical protein